MSSAAEALLLACVHRDPQQLVAATLPAPDSAVWDDLVALAGRQRVRPLVHRRLAAVRGARSIPERVLQALEPIVRQTVLRNLRYHAEVAAIARALARDDVDVLMLKGADLIATTYESPSLREMNDIDLLVRREHLALTVAAIGARGYRPHHEFSIEVETALRHHLTGFEKPGVASIEIHWTITNPTSAQAIDPASLWARATPMTLGGTRVLTLSREDLLLHLCFHASHQHQLRFGLRPFCDIAALVAREGAHLDWPGLAERARTWRWERGVYLTLRLTRDLVGGAIPDAALDALKPAQVPTRILDAARAQVFAAAETDDLQPGIARLTSSETLWARLGHLRRRLLPSRLEMARLYGLPPGSARIHLYLHRAGDLVLRHGAPAARLLLGRDTAFTDAASRTNQIRQWLDS
jgi:hypothetical protein